MSSSYSLPWYVTWFAIPAFLVFLMASTIAGGFRIVRSYWAEHHWIPFQAEVVQRVTRGKESILIYRYTFDDKNYLGEAITASIGGIPVIDGKVKIFTDPQNVARSYVPRYFPWVFLFPLNVVLIIWGVKEWIKETFSSISSHG